MIFGKSYEEFLNDLAARESEGKYDAQNTFGYSGKYQMGEAALIDAGYYKPDGTKGKYQDWIGTWTGKDGVNSIEDFLSNATAQENAIRDYMAKQWQYIERFGLEKYVGQNIGGIEITESGLLAAAHLKGVGSLKRFLTSGGKGTFKDGYGTDIREYLSRFSNYDVPFDGNSLSEVISNLFNKMTEMYNSIKQFFTTAFDRLLSITRRDPLMVDLDGDGVETTNVKDGAFFDHDANGFSEQTGWVSPDDGLLVMDRNNDGIINDGKELFGDQTILSNGQKAANGFEALREQDSNADGKIDANDAAWSQIKVWQDTDGDGYSTSDELHTLDEVGIKSINLTSTPNTVTDPQGNTQTRTGSFEKTDGTTGIVGEYNLQRDTAYTIANEWLDVPEDIAALPDLQGYGNMYDLQQAMARERQTANGEGLKALIEQFIATTDTTTRNSLMEQILFKWTNSDTIDPTSRGGNFDARKLAVLEKFFGQAFVAQNGTNPSPEAATLLKDAYRGLSEMMYSQLMAQTHLKDIYAKINYSWDDATQSVKADMSNVITDIQNQLTANPDLGKEALGEFARTIRGFGAQDMVNYLNFRETFINIDPSLGWIIDSAGLSVYEMQGTDNTEAVRGSLTEGNGYIAGGAGNDVIYGTDRDESLSNKSGWYIDRSETAISGDAIMVAGGGNDTIWAGQGNDILDGGQGNDQLYGEAGNDTYIFRSAYEKWDGSI